MNLQKCVIGLSSTVLATNINHIVGLQDPANLNCIADMVRRQRTASINEFEISRDSSTNTWYVMGAGLQRFVQMTNWRYVNNRSSVSLFVSTKFCCIPCS